MTTAAQPRTPTRHGAPLSVTRDSVTRWVRALHDELTDLFRRLDGGGEFREDAWERDGGGGGTARVLTEGRTFEKAGINRSAVHGILPASAATRLGAHLPVRGPSHFFAAGVSLVVHPRSPMIPTVHLNVRYFEIADADGTVHDRWFGGGTDLTPFHPHEDDARHFHLKLREVAMRHHPLFYPRFKSWCDQYFTSPHRGGEARGVGGIFFDHLRPGEDESGLGAAALFAFVRDVGRSLGTAYAPLVERRRDERYGERERAFQLVRRGRYVEFNLLHDRGTLFGLQTGARVESVLMSLPPAAAWSYDARYEPGTPEARLMGMLAPRDWV